jgi:pimeloyl-ACP methyl ester carboxylesterase
VLVREFGFRVIAPDPPGHGRSPPLAQEAYLPSRLARVAGELLDALGVSEAVSVGFSVGAEVACAFGARYSARTAALVLVDGGYSDFADLPDFDVDAGLATRVARARERASDEVYPGWDAYFDYERSAIGRWSPELEAAHRATMRERDGKVEPIITPETVGGIRHGNCVEPTVSTQAALRAARMPVLLVTPARHGQREALARAGIERFRANVPQLEVEELPTGVHDLVSYAGPDLAVRIGSWLIRRG